jgi:phosphatidylglycerol:prolipoprotein diacylglycerol transferase
MIPYFTVHLPEILGIPIQIFGLMVAAGFLVGDYLIRKRAVKVGQDPQLFSQLLLVVIISGVLSAHLFQLVAYEPQKLWTNPWSILDFRSGLSSFGGFFGAAVATFVFLWRKNLPFLPYADTIVFGAVPGQCLGRVGCFLVHDHPGRLTDFFLGVQWPGGTRHDLGFYEMIFTFFLSLFLYGLANKIKRKPFDGFYLAVVLIIYGLVRFGLDQLRIEDSRYGYLTPAQYGCIVFVLLGVYLMLRGRKHKNS